MHNNAVGSLCSFADSNCVYMYALVADCACGQGQAEIRRSVFRRGWCPKLSSQLKRDHKSLTYRGRHQVGQVDLELPTHPLPEAQ